LGIGLANLPERRVEGPASALTPLLQIGVDLATADAAFAERSEGLSKRERRREPMLLREPTRGRGLPPVLVRGFDGR